MAYIFIIVLLVLLVVAALLFVPLRLLSADFLLAYGQFDRAENILYEMPFKSARERVLSCRFNRCSSLIAQSDYPQAEIAFASLNEYSDLSDKFQEYSYLLSVDMFEAGQYETAREWFLTLGDWKDSERMAYECSYQIAKGLMERKDLDGAITEFDSISSYLDSSALADACREEIYQHATKCLFRCEFRQAADLFGSIASYGDSKRYEEYCLEREALAAEPVDFPYKYVTDSHLQEAYDHGKLYRHFVCWLYVPDEITENTKTLIYYPGGIGGDMLYYSGVLWYFNNYAPDAVILFFCGSGFYDMTGKNRLAMDIMHQVEQECGFVMHNLVLAGSSNGCFSAFRAAAQFYSMYGYRVDTLLSFDAGYDFIIPLWEQERYLTDDECDILAEAGTHMCLFEQPGVGLDYPDIKKMVDHEMYVTIIECRSVDHNRISVNAYTNGLFSWGLGEIELDPEEYTVVELSNSVYSNN